MFVLNVIKLTPVFFNVSLALEHLFEFNSFLFYMENATFMFLVGQLIMFLTEYIDGKITKQYVGTEL